jgi:hypothetical protein
MDSLRITTTVQDSLWKVSASLEQREILPAAIFIYENTGTIELGRYVGVCNFQEVCRLPVWEGLLIKKFGNRFVRHSSADLFIPLSQDLASKTKHLTDSVSALKAEILAQINKTEIVPV